MDSQVPPRLESEPVAHSRQHHRAKFVHTRQSRFLEFAASCFSPRSNNRVAKRSRTFEADVFYPFLAFKVFDRRSHAAQQRVRGDARKSGARPSTRTLDRMVTISAEAIAKVEQMVSGAEPMNWF